jgi:alanyl-tRNA synthetase
MIEAIQLRQMYLDFFASEHKHAIIGGASLIPEQDPSVLFTTAGMHPLVPYLLGERHPAGTRLVDFQKCLRTDDIDEVGDSTHLTFFEMLGNWSLNDYWKAESLAMSYQFLTEKLGLDADRLYVTCFAGDADAPRDLESAEIWRALGIPVERISFLPKADNWWGPAGTSGPCGPDSEIFYDTQPDGPAGENPATNGKRFWELWNNVFMQYEKMEDGRYLQMARRNVDTGMGLERTVAALNGKHSVYETELLFPIVEEIRRRAQVRNDFAERVVADHLRSASFILAEGILPGNADQPYIARRLIRRAVRYGKELAIPGHFTAQIGETVIRSLNPLYPELEAQGDKILGGLDAEEERFGRTLQKGELAFFRAIEALPERSVPGDVVFHLYDTYGFPPELTAELAGQQGYQADMAGYRQAFAEHQERSRQGASARFKGGLSERSPQTTRLHTATHLLQAALRQVLGSHVGQRGSNITTERLRFDFNHPDKVTPQELAQVEEIVNAQVERALPVSWQEMSVDEAKAQGAIGLFEDRYGERVKVYRIGDVSLEICGGPHVQNTSELGHFKIAKEEAVASGVRRIRAVLEGE